MTISSFSKRSRASAFIAAVMVLLATASCGGDDTDAPNAAATSTTAEGATGDGATDSEDSEDSEDASPTTTRRGDTTASNDDDDGTSSASGTGGGDERGGTTTTSLKESPLRGKTDKACARPGEQQGLTIRFGEPKQPLIYDTVYSNRTNSMTSNYDTGTGTGEFGEDGTYHTTWVLAPNVPPGTAYIQFASTIKGEIARGLTSFEVAAIGASCD